MSPCVPVSVPAKITWQGANAKAKRPKITGKKQAECLLWVGSVIKQTTSTLFSDLVHAEEPGDFDRNVHRGTR